MKSKKFTPEERKQILEEGDKYGIKATVAKYGISTSTYYSWKKNSTDLTQIDDLKAMENDNEKTYQLLLKENEHLKLLLLEVEEKNSMKEAIIRKLYSKPGKKS